MVCGFFLWSMSLFHDQVFAICGKTVGALRRNLILPLPGWLGSAFQITEHRADNKIVVRLGDRVNTYYLFGGQDESSYMLIQGITLAGVLLDEVVLMPRSFVEQACARCSVPESKLWFSCNPGSTEHWFYKEWICKADSKHALRLHFTMEDNPGLSEKVRQRYDRLYTGVFYKRYVLGQWCQSQGLVYQLSQENITEVIPERGQWYISVDYGTKNPFSAGLWCVENGVAVRVREFYYDSAATGKMLTDQDYYDRLLALCGNAPVQQVIVDPSAASFITLIRRQGRFRVRKAQNKVLPGIRLVASLLQQKRLQIHQSCKDALREFRLYCWEEDPGRDVPRKENDHAMDEIRYFAMGVMGRLDNG